MGLLTETLPNLALARPGLDRHAERRLEPDLLATLLADPATRVLEVHGDKVPVVTGPESAAPVLDLRPPVAADARALVLYLGQDRGGDGGGNGEGNGGGKGDGTAYLAVAGPEPEEGKADDRLLGMRQVGADLSDRDATIFATALALANWHAAHPHCPRCGARTEPVQAGWLRRCPADGSEHYPRTDVAVIMSVVDDQDRILLARGAGWGTGRFSVLAGFLEPGESLAAAVAREVHEEVGLRVHDVEYLGDQPWPFPTSLMVGFTARAHDSELRLQESEIAEARWFTRQEYREILAAGQVSASTRLSISRRIIERWLGHELDAGAPA